MSSISIKNLEFEKLHGLGNDYIVINDIKYKIPEQKKPDLARKLCEHHFSVGADGLIFVNESEVADIRMRIFNNDGSEAEMCGNGIRCFSKHVYENDIVKKESLNIETLKGIQHAKLNIKNGNVISVQIDMGPPILNCNEIPVIPSSNTAECINEPLPILDKILRFTAVSMGNPHAVIVVKNQLDDNDLFKYGALIESHEKFPKNTNVEFIQILSKTELSLRVFERSVGITKSCGTGSCAAVVAGTILGILEENKPITVHNDGGDLLITYTGETVLMEGPITHVFKGYIEELTF
ncbi:MAG: diaminopimelate epimerase [Promethearchaeota archaeon]